MRKIQLRNNRGIVLVDDEDYERLKHFKWYRHQSKRPTHMSSPAYACTPKPNKKGMDMMHRIIMGAKTGEFIDHVDGNGLNNQKCNLRICTIQQNGFNQKKQQRKTSSQFKGVRKKKDVKYWEAYIKINQKWTFLGHHKSEIEAAKAYNRKAQEIFGEFALLNELPET